MHKRTFGSIIIRLKKKFPSKYYRDSNNPKNSSTPTHQALYTHNRPFIPLDMKIKIYFIKYRFDLMPHFYHRHHQQANNRLC